MIAGTNDALIIVNADDFGLTPGVSSGIIRAHRQGIVTSATIMANMPFVRPAVELASECRDMGLGLHINLTQGHPVSPASELQGLIDNKNCLPGVAGLMSRAWRVRDAMRREISAQFEAVMAMGAEIGHFDSHKHIHVHPRVLRAVITTAKDYGIEAIRAPVEQRRTRLIRTTRGGATKATLIRALAFRARAILKREGFLVTDQFVGITRTGNWDAESMAAAVLDAEAGVTELMVHPGEVDDELRKAETRLIESRQTELNVLVSEEVKVAVNDRRAKLISFGEMIRASENRGR